MTAAGSRTSRAPGTAPRPATEDPGTARVIPWTSRRTPVDLEVVVPAYNEAHRLAGTLTSTVAFLADRPWTSRVVVVDNGSSDATVRVAQRAVRRAGGTAPGGTVDVVVIACAGPGKGAAVRRGMLSSRARFVGFTDADMATPIETLDLALAALEDGAAAAIGSRYAPGAHLVRRQPLTRRAGGAVFRALATRMVPGVHDTQCGFKFFSRPAAQAALLRCSLSGFAFDVELLRQVRAGGGSIVELPVAWTDGARSSLRPLRDGVPAVLAALRLQVGRA